SPAMRSSGVRPGTPERWQCRSQISTVSPRRMMASSAVGLRETAACLSLLADFEVVIELIHLARLDLGFQRGLVVVPGRYVGLHLLHVVLLAGRAAFVAHPVPIFLARWFQGPNLHPVFSRNQPALRADGILPVLDPRSPRLSHSRVQRDELDAPLRQRRTIDR